MTADSRTRGMCAHRGNGRNVTEYIPRDHVTTVEENIDAYERFKALVDEQFARISEKSRQQRKARK